MSSIAQRVFYIGNETTPGTGVTVDVALRATGSLQVMPTKKRPEEYIGSFAPTRHYITSLRAQGELTMPGTYEQAPYMVSMALGAGAVVTTSDPEEWSFLLPMAGTAPTFSTYTCEYSDGANHIVKATDVFSTALEISGEADGEWMFKNTLVGGNATFPAAVSATPTPPATPRAILMAETALKWADDGDLESAVAMDEFISFVYKVENLQHQKLFAGSLYPTGRGHNVWNVSLELTVEIDNATVEAQKEKLLTNEQTAIQIRAEAVDAGGEGIDWYAEIRGVFHLADVGVIDERDGNNIVKLTYSGEKDILIDAITTQGVLFGNDLQAL
jgi:hypothetical protein